MKCHLIIKEHPRWKVSIERFIACAGKAWQAPGSSDYWLSIARCESGFYWRSYNYIGPHVGIYQHALSAWAGRVARYIAPLDFRHTAWERPEVNIIVAMRMASADGTWTRQWTCA